MASSGIDNRATEQFAALLQIVRPRDEWHASLSVDKQKWTKQMRFCLPTCVPILPFGVTEGELREVKSPRDPALGFPVRRDMRLVYMCKTGYFHPNGKLHLYVFWYSHFLLDHQSCKQGLEASGFSTFLGAIWSLQLGCCTRNSESIDMDWAMCSQDSESLGTKSRLFSHYCYKHR